MKFLPLKYRETMCEFFGKRGLGWHISAVVTKKDSRIEVECFVHIFKFLHTEQLRSCIDI